MSILYFHQDLSKYHLLVFSCLYIKKYFKFLYQFWCVLMLDFFRFVKILYCIRCTGSTKCGCTGYIHTHCHVDPNSQSVDQWPLGCIELTSSPMAMSKNCRNTAGFFCLLYSAFLESQLLALQELLCAGVQDLLFSKA